MYAIRSYYVSFQGYARGADGSALQNEPNLEVRFTIFSSDENNPAFIETQTLSTDEYGVFHAVIGSVNSNAFNSINFSGDDYSIKVEVMDAGAYQQVARQSLLAVPYAKASEKANEATMALNGCPPGSIMPFAGSEVPTGWLLCDGSAKSRTTYAALYAAIGQAWGPGNGSSTFHLPDLRGQFLRGVANGQGTDPNRGSRYAKNSGGNTGDKVGTYQNDATAMPDNKFTTATSGNHRHGYDDIYFTENGGNDGKWGSNSSDRDNRYQVTREANNMDYSGNHTHTINGGDNESRPTNAYVNYIIKY